MGALAALHESANDARHSSHATMWSGVEESERSAQAERAQAQP
jgi:hypothetical protein